MQVPKAPKKPIKPQAPDKNIIQSFSVDLWNYDGDRLSYVLESQFPGIPLNELRISVDYRGYDGGTINIYRSWEELDPKYDEKMTKYHKKLEEYKEARRQYKLDVEEYKEKLKIWHEEQLKVLTE